jgi:MacB-like periplasmic core domain
VTLLRVFLARVRGLLGRRGREAELHDEIQTHLDRLADDYLRRGVSPAEARMAARREFGAVDQIKETYRDQRGLRFVDSLIQDIRYALRTLCRNPGFTAVAVAILAVGIGVNVTVFTVTNATLFKGFPLVHRNDRLLYVTTNRWCCVSYPDFEDWRAQAKSFEGMALVRGVGITFSDQSGFPERFAVTEVTADTFRLVGQQPIIGRDFAPADDTPGANPVAVLSYGFWERRYGMDPTILDRTVRLNGVPTTVIGIMPRGFPSRRTRISGCH